MTGTPDSRDVLSTWKAAWQHAAFRVQIVVTVPVLILLLALFSRFLEWVEQRPGAILQDPVVASLPAYDFTWPIFIIIYAGLVVGLVTLSSHPANLLTALQSYSLMVCVRLVMMFTAPLDPPGGIIPLADPFVQFFGSGQVPTRDLFFSGHTSTLLLLSFTATRYTLKAFFVMCALVVGILIVWQHVHYAMDVLVAPFIAYTCYRIVILFHSRFLTMGDYE